MKWVDTLIFRDWSPCSMEAELDDLHAGILVTAGKSSMPPPMFETPSYNSVYLYQVCSQCGAIIDGSVTYKHTEFHKKIYEIQYPNDGNPF